jgi:hypothetical protein
MKSGLQGMWEKNAEKACHGAMGLADKFLRDTGFEQQQGERVEPITGSSQQNN